MLLIILRFSWHFLLAPLCTTRLIGMISSKQWHQHTLKWHVKLIQNRIYACAQIAFTSQCNNHELKLISMTTWTHTVGTANSVARVFLSQSGRAAHPENQNEDKNEGKLRKRKEKIGNFPFLPTLDWEFGFVPEAYTYLSLPYICNEEPWPLVFDALNISSMV